MKKLFAIALCALIVICSALTSGAACEHNYTAEQMPATCVSRACAVYTCVACGDTYTEFVPLYEVPDGFYTLVEADRDGDTLTATVSIDNSTGIWAAALSLRYNPAALEPVSAETGDILTSGSSVKINEEKEYVRFYWQNGSDANNTENGVLFTAVFMINAPINEWGLELSYGARDFVNYDNGAVDVTAVSTVYLGYGEHTYDEGTVTSAPTFDAEGSVLYSCTLCAHTKIETLPRLLKGDVNGDGAVDMKDSYTLKRRVADITMVGVYDERLDLSLDGIVNAKDLLIVKKIIAGVYQDN